MPDIISKGVRSDSLIFYLIKILQATINEASKRKHIFHKLDLVLQFFKSQEKNHGSLYDRARNYRNVIGINAVSGRKLSCLRKRYEI